MFLTGLLYDSYLDATESISNFPNEPLRIRGSQHKGDDGVFLVIGGNEMYTGAPYYASKAAYMTGINLIYILTCENNPVGALATSLKALLPQCIIIPILAFCLETHSVILNRVTTVLFGSGLGTPNHNIVTKIGQVFDYLAGIAPHPFTVIDGDGIRFLSVHKNIPIMNIILTPNINEAKHLPKIIHSVFCVLAKGYYDILMHGQRKLAIQNEGSMRRCGGIGDVLAGLIASFVNHQMDPFEAVKTASLLTRELSKRTWQKLRISMSTEDILNELKLHFSDEKTTIIKWE